MARQNQGAAELMSPVWSGLVRRGIQGAVLVAFAAIVLVGHTVGAYGGVQGVTYFEGINPGNYSFIPTNDQGSDSLLGSVLPNYTGWGPGSGAIGDTIMNTRTPASVSRKEKFYNLLYWEYHWGNAWERAGSAQIALSLLGYGFGSHTLASMGNPAYRQVTDAQWTDLRARLVDNSDLDMVWRGASEGNGVSRRNNTGGVMANGKYDSVRVDNGDDLMVDAWEFRSISSGTSYAIYEIACGNGIGTINGLPQPANWSTSGWSKVGVGAPGQAFEPNVTYWPYAKPNERVTWRHGVYNNGPNATSQIAFAINKDGFTNGWNNSPLAPQGSFSLAPNQTIEMGYNRWWDSYSIYDLTQDDVGHRICESVSWGPSASADVRWRNSGDWTGVAGGACVYVPYDFKLTPTVKAPTDTIESGAPIRPIDPNVNNSGPTKSYDNAQWQLSKFILPSGAAKPDTADTNGAPCSYYKNNCVNVGSGNQTFAVGDSTVGSLMNYVADNVEPGSRICFALSVTGYDADHQPNSGWWRNGVPTCIVVGKKPKIQVWGGDVATRGDINVSQTEKTNGVFGSWVEYGAFSVGTNSRFASGAGLSPKPIPQTSNAPVDWSKLTFANTPPPQYGHYTGAASDFRAFPNITQYFKAMTTRGTFFKDKAGAPENTFLTGGAVQVMTAGDLTLSSDTIPKGRSAVIIASGTVTITGDITYDDKQPLSSPRELPQLVIIANKININQNVTNVDAWLVTSDTKAGVIDTCADVSLPLSSKVCDTKLTIHGPVVAGELHLKRTGGSGADEDSGEPAEFINLRPDAFLWAELVASGAGKAETVNTTELPPRF